MHNNNTKSNHPQHYLNFSPAVLHMLNGIHASEQLAINSIRLWVSRIIRPSEQCKSAGLKGLADLSEISSVSPRTLINWHKDKPQLFATVLAGAVVLRKREGVK